MHKITGKPAYDHKSGSVLKKFGTEPDFYPFLFHF